MYYSDEHLEIRFVDAKVRLDGRPMELTRKEWMLLATLAANRGEIISRKELLSQIWGYSDQIKTRTLDVHIRRLRRKLGDFGESYIETVFGVGYRFQQFRSIPAVHTFLPAFAAIAS